MQYDITSKVIVEKGKLSLFRYFQKRQPADIQLIQKLPQKMPSIKKSDCILKVTESNGAQEIQVWEFKTQWNTQDILNLMDYTIRAKQTYRLPVKPVLFLFLEHPKATGEYQDENFQFRFDLIKLWEEDAQSVLDSEDYFLYPFIPVMKGDESLVFTAEKKLYNSGIGKEDKSDLLSALTLFAGLRDKELCLQLFQQRRNLMIESYAYEIFRQDALETACKEVLKQGLEHGWEKGLEHGRYQGREQGWKQGLKKGRKQGWKQGLEHGRELGFVLKGRKDVLNVLRVRFQDVPSSIKAFVESVDQEAALDLLHENAITAASLPEFEDFIYIVRF